MGAVAVLESNYFKTPDQIFDVKGLSGYAKLVYVFLCRAADKQGKSWYSYNSIAQKVSFSRSTIIRAVKELECFGLVIKETRKKTKFTEEYNDTNLYTVKWYGSSTKSSSVSEDYPDSSVTHKGISREGRLDDVDKTQLEEQQIKELIEETAKDYTIEEKEILEKDIEAAIEKYQPKKKLAYIKKMLEKYQPKQKVVSITNKQNKSTYKSNNQNNYGKTKFHNFEQVASKYTNQQLENIWREDQPVEEVISEEELKRRTELLMSGDF